MTEVNSIVCANDMLSVTHRANIKALASREEDLAMKIGLLQLLWILEFCIIFKYGIPLRFQLIIDKCFLSFSPFNEAEVFLLRALSLSKWNRV